jgi:hypothetical protein
MTPNPSRNRARAGAAAALAALTLAACGTTVSSVTANQSGTSGGSGGLGAPGSQSAASGGPSAQGPSSLSAGSGQANGAGTTSGGQSGGTSAGNGSTSSGSATATAGNGPGITASTIYLGDAYDPDAAQADAAIGAAGLNPGDTKAETEAVIAYLNSHGGIAHRKVVPVWYKQSVSNDANTTEQAECATWTQDNKVFVLQNATQIIDQCAQSSGAINVSAGVITSETSAILQHFPGSYNMSGLVNDRAMRYTIEGLAKLGYFSKGAKVGIATWDDPVFTYSIQHAAIPALAKLGIRNVPVKYVTSPQSYGDLGATSSSARSAILNFQTTGIDHVILFDGQSGVNSSGILVIEWMNQAQSQSYNPKYGLNSTSGLSTIAPDVPAQQLAGAEGVGWMPGIDLANADFAALPMSARGKLCLQIMKDAGQQQSGANAITIQLGICDRMFLLKQVFDSMTGPINQATAEAALNALGTTWQPTVTFGQDFSASRHDGAYLVRNATFNSGCGCFKYTGQAYSPGD